MDPIKAAKLSTQVDELQQAFENCTEEFSNLWNIVEELHVRTSYIMEKVILVHREPSIIEGAPPKETRASLTKLFAQERETFIARMNDVQTKLAALRSGAHLATQDDDLGAAAGAAPGQTAQGPRDGNGQLVRL